MPALVPELICSDLAASRAFYVNTLGFRVLYERPETGFAKIEREGAEIMLESHTPDRWITAPLERPFGRGINFEIIVSDLDALRARIRRPVFRETEEVWYRVDDREIGVRQFAMLDPDGYLLRFQETLGWRALSGARGKER